MALIQTGSLFTNIGIKQFGGMKQTSRIKGKFKKHYFFMISFDYLLPLASLKI